MILYTHRFINNMEIVFLWIRFDTDKFIGKRRICFVEMRQSEVIWGVFLTGSCINRPIWKTVFPAGTFISRYQGSLKKKFSCETVATIQQWVLRISCRYSAIEMLRNVILSNYHLFLLDMTESQWTSYVFRIFILHLAVQRYTPNINALCYLYAFYNYSYLFSVLLVKLIINWNFCASAVTW